MAAEIEETYPDVEVECVPGSAGVFKIIIDGKVLFDKKMTGRYPGDGEILSLIKYRTGDEVIFIQKN